MRKVAQYFLKVNKPQILHLQEMLQNSYFLNEYRKSSTQNKKCWNAYVCKQKSDW